MMVNPIKNSIGELIIAATPIGNLSDITIRFMETVKKMDIILCEDTRKCKTLLKNIEHQATIQSFNKDNEHTKANNIIDKLQSGFKIMLTSDAGTPLIQDPGFQLVKECHQLNITVNALPGPCAAISALSISGIESNQFTFYGYLSKTREKRKKMLLEFKEQNKTAIYYLTPHKILQELKDMIDLWGKHQIASLVKEISKINEQTQYGTLADIYLWLLADIKRQKGEFVLMVSAINNKKEIRTQQKISNKSIQCMEELSKHLNLSTSAKITAKITGDSKKTIYNFFTQQKTN